MSVIRSVAEIGRWIREFVEDVWALLPFVFILAFFVLGLWLNLGRLILVLAHLDAVTGCPQRVERVANYAFRWTDGFGELKLRLSLTEFKEESSFDTYVGDAIEFQNAYGAWQPHVYECDVDFVTGEVIEVRAEPGRLPVQESDIWSW